MTEGEGTAARFAPLLFAAAAALLAQDKPFVERVQVNVRTILVVVRTSDGRPAHPALVPGDLEVREDGVPVRILGIDAVQSSKPGAETSREAGEPLSPPAPAGMPPGLTQYLYIDAPMLGAFSVRRLSRALVPSAAELASTGPFGIVVADPSPLTRLEPTRDAARIRDALEATGRAVSGRERLLIARRQTLDEVRQDPGRSLKSGRIQSAAEQELQIVRASLESLRGWAAPFGSGRPMILYLASDGFDVDTSEAYREALGPEAMAGDDASTLISLQTDFATRGARLLDETSQELAALGVTVVGVSLGSHLPESANDASVSGGPAFRLNRSEGPQSVFVRPMEPLRMIAGETGGDVATTEGALSKLLAESGDAYFVSFRSDRPPDGGVHRIEIASRRADLNVRGPRVLTEGSPASVAAGRTVRALRGEATPGDLTVRLALDGVQKDSKKFSGTLHVTSDFDPIVDALELLETAKVRVTIAVEVEGAKEPFVTHDEVNAPRMGEGTLWSYDAPITWPKKGRRVAVTVEELRTGSRGTAALDLPR